jgi:signal transduction histidine kinase/CheY-like chemotaxis protein
VRQLTAVALTIVVCLATRHSPFIDDGGFFLVLSITVLGSAWFAGTGAALASTVAGAIYGYVSDTPATPAVETHLALFVIQGLLMAAIVAELRRARRAAERETHIARVARHEAEAANRTKDEFLAVVSHELRTPLNAVLGWLHLIRTGRLDEATVARGLESIERNVRLQAQFTADMLDISKALTGKLQLDTRAVSLAATVQEAIAQVTTAASAKDVQLRVAIPAGSPIVVRGDANRLRQVACHLLANAIKFTPRGGTIDVSMETNDHASLTVRDSGPGIDPEFLPRIFDRFTQADTSPTRTAGGLGVGLALVRELVERHGGEIEARNSEARGAIFVVRLPIHAEDQRTTSVPCGDDVVHGVRSLAGVRVLFVDRDDDTREAFVGVLRRQGAEVRGAASVADGLELLEAWRPDVLVSDSVSADRDAYAVIGKVHTLEAERGGRIPALALTRAASGDEHLQRLISDVHHRLPKPVDPATLAAEIAWMAGRERQRARR